MAVNLVWKARLMSYILLSLEVPCQGLMPLGKLQC